MKLANKYKPIKDNWYSWTVLVDGSAEEMSKIKHVKYRLHESFPNKRQVSTSSVDNFARSNNGWGEFLIKADVEMDNGEVKRAELWLDLGFEHTKDKKKKYTGEFKD